MVAVLDDVHSAMRHSNHNNNNVNNISSSSGSGNNGIKSNAHRQGLGQGPLLALLYTVALRNTALQNNVTLSKGQAIRLMEHQRHHGVRPYWSCVRYALKGKHRMMIDRLTNYH